MGADNVSSFAVATSGRRTGALLPVSGPFTALEPQIHHCSSEAWHGPPAIALAARNPAESFAGHVDGDGTGGGNRHAATSRPDLAEATEGHATARAAQVAKVEEGAALGPFRPDGASLRNYRETAWFDNAEFGTFVHRGVDAAPAFAGGWYAP